MDTPPNSRTDETITILSVSPTVEDHRLLQQILSHHDHSQWAKSTWKLKASFDVDSAASALKEHAVSIVLCESQLSTGTWHEILRHVSALDDPPLLIVTSKFADERLWAEALHLGAFDVIAKPYNAEEVKRTVMLAWQHWRERHGLHRRRTKQRKHGGAV
jgi:DNA-binding NtrC family response regulator